MGDGMTKAEAVKFTRLESQVDQTHKMVTDLHECLYQNGFLEDVKKNTAHRVDSETKLKEKHNFWLIFNRTMVTSLSLLAITALAKYLFTGSPF